MVAHAGDPRILDDLARNLGVPREKLQRSYASLDEDGNLGAASVLRVLERTYAAPPTDEASGLLIAFGP